MRIAKCPVCQVEIVCNDGSEPDQVLFSFGKPGTRNKLFARVCQYAKDKASCINKGPTHDDCVPTDYYIEFEPKK